MSAGQALFGIDPVNPNEQRVGEEHLCCARGQRSHQCEPVAPQMAAGHDYFDSLLIAKLHRHIHRVGDDGNAAKRLKAAHYLCSGGPAAERDGVPATNQIGRRSGNPALLLSETAHFILKGWVVAERLVKQGPNGYSPAARAAQ
jgi:hypothetical protein